MCQHTRENSAGNKPSDGEYAANVPKGRFRPDLINLGGAGTTSTGDQGGTSSDSGSDGQAPGGDEGDTFVDPWCRDGLDHCATL